MIEKGIADGFELIKTAVPAVVTTSYEVGALREPGVEAFMSAGKKPLTVWNAQQLGLENVKTSRTDIIKMYQPSHTGQCVMIEGTAPEQKAVNMVKKLKEIKVI